MHVDRVDLSAIQPMDVGATLPSDGCPQLRERHGPFHSTPPLVGSKPLIWLSRPWLCCSLSLSENT